MYGRLVLNRLYAVLIFLFHFVAGIKIPKFVFTFFFCCVSANIQCQFCFTDQLTQIYGTTLAAVICRNSDAVDRVQKFVMRRIEVINNPMVSCSEIDTFSFDAWTEQPYHRNFVSLQTGPQASFIRTITKAGA